MNLNFYNPSHANSLEGLQNSLQEQIAKLNELKSVQIQGMNPPKIQQPLQEQRYYLDCGNKQDWTEFLRINYGLTETQIFDDYKLFLQAKAELNEDNNKEKLEAMKQKLSPSRKEKGNVSNDLQSNVQSYVQPTTIQNVQPINNEPIYNVSSTNVSNNTTSIQPMQQVPVQGIINASNSTVVGSTNANQANINKLAKNTLHNENKGVKYAR